LFAEFHFDGNTGDQEDMIDEQVRKLRYQFFKLPKPEQLQILMQCHLVTDIMANNIPGDFFTTGFNHALIHGGIDRIAEHPWIKELDKDGNDNRRVIQEDSVSS
jgi:hypothetical protein